MTGAAFPPAEREQRALLSIIRHELRTPINAILGYSEILLEDAAEMDAGAEFAGDLTRIHEAGEQLLARLTAVLESGQSAEGDVDLEAFGEALRHELRTPINTVIGYSEMLLEDAADRGWDASTPDLEKIHGAADRFLALIDDVVMFRTVEADHTGLSREGVAQTELVADAMRSIPSFDERSAHRADRAALHPILIVDDNAINREMLSRRLERQGYGVALAENGREALAMARAQPYDLILLDMMMPEMNGYEVLQIWMADATLRDIPVIIVSALDEVDSVARCVELGAADYLTKPFNPILLHARIEACLEKKWLRDQEVEYLRNVSLLTGAAASVEAGAFEPQSIADIAARGDGLGNLARVFQRMAREVVAREERLKQEVQALRIEIDQTRKSRAVDEIVGSEYFQRLQQRAARLRDRRT